MAGQVKFSFAFILVFHVSLVSCRPDYHQYFSQYIKDETSTESSLSSTTGISTGKSENISIPEVLYSGNVISPKANSYSSSNNDAYEKPVQSAYSSADNENARKAQEFVTLLIIIGCSVAALLILCCCVICCICCCCKGRERRGFVIGITIPNQPTVNVMQPQFQQEVTMQHFPPETQTPQYPPPYNTQPIQQQLQCSSPPHLLHQNPMQQMDQQHPLMPQEYSDPATVPPPYPIKS